MSAREYDRWPMIDGTSRRADDRREIERYLEQGPAPESVQAYLAQHARISDAAQMIDSKTRIILLRSQRLEEALPSQPPPAQELQSLRSDVLALHHIATQVADHARFSVRMELVGRVTEHRMSAVHGLPADPGLQHRDLAQTLKARAAARSLPALGRAGSPEREPEREP